MQTLKDYLSHITVVLLLVVCILVFLLVRSSKKNASLKADLDLTTRKDLSKIVDDKVKSIQTNIDGLNKEMNKPVPDDFWKEYTKDIK